MTGIIAVILGILGAAAPYLPVVEEMLAGIGVFLATEFKKLFGVDAPAQLESAIATATAVVTTVDKDIPAVIAYLENFFGSKTISIVDFVANAPGTAKAMFAQQQLMDAHGLSKAAAAKLVENAHGAMVIAKAP